MDGRRTHDDLTDEKKSSMRMCILAGCCIATLLDIKEYVTEEDVLRDMRVVEKRFDV